MIARDKDLKRIIVSNGIIVDKAFERINEDDISDSITKNNPQLKLYIYLLPIPKDKRNIVTDENRMKDYKKHPDKVF